MRFRIVGVFAVVMAALSVACGDDGMDGMNGMNGSSCSVSDTVMGALITCQDGTSAMVFDGTDGADGAPGPAGPPGAPGADGADGVGCTSSLLVDGYEITCSNGTVYVDTMNGVSSELSRVDVTASEVVLVASKKNGGSGGSRWFDAAVTLDPPTTLTLPSSIPAVGNPGNGQKLYVLFNDTTDCAWYSGGGAYSNFRCFGGGATRNGGTSEGFTGGVEVFPTEIVGATTIDMTVSGASGSGVLTTATATFAVAP